MQERKSKLAELQREKVKLLERYGEKHPQVVNINATLSDAQRQLDLELSMAVQSVRNEYETALLEERTLSKNLEGAKAEATDLNRKGIGYGVMEREAKSNRQVYEALLHAREGAAGLGEQPHQQHPHRRSRRGAAVADHAGRAAHLADVGAGRADCCRSRSRSASTT